jgi:HSP20 family molecular chaperone IbpA
VVHCGEARDVTGLDVATAPTSGSNDEAGERSAMNATNAQVTEETATTEAEMRPQSVPVNLYETSGALVLVAPMPAVTPDDVCVELRPGDPATLRVWAHVRSASPREYLLHEWEYGGYERQVDLPAGYGGGAEATLRNGQLVVRVLRVGTGDDAAAEEVVRITPSGAPAE